VRTFTGLTALFFAATAGMAAASCSADPTQVRVRIRTTVPCDQLNGVVINAAGDPKAVEERVKQGFLDATTDKGQCDANGDIGTVYLVPGQNRAALVVRAGYGTRVPSECQPPNYDGCIVARRTIPYVDQTTLTITVNLDPNCLNVPCGVLSTCSSGKCVSSEASVCNGGECGLDPAKGKPEDERNGGTADGGGADASPGVDGGGADGGGSVDGGSVDGGSVDGGQPGLDSGGGDSGPTDAGSPADASDAGGPTDGGSDGAITPSDGGVGTPGRVRCVFVNNPQLTVAQETLFCQPDELCTAMVGDFSGACNGPFMDGLKLMCTRSSECLPNKSCWLAEPVGPNGPLITTCAPTGNALVNHRRVCDPGGACPAGGGICMPVPVGPGMPPKPILYACQ
jgi:hypothetical protein